MLARARANRIFAHMHEALESPQENDKLAQIRAIHAEGLEVQPVVLRHGLEPDCASQVEAAFIDFVGNLPTSRAAMAPEPED